MNRIIAPGHPGYQRGQPPPAARPAMRTGTGILLLTVGAILLFALKSHSPHWLNLHIVGGILILAGGLGLLLPRLARSRRRPPATAPPRWPMTSSATSRTTEAMTQTHGPCGQVPPGTARAGPERGPCRPARTSWAGSVSAGPANGCRGYQGSGPRASEVSQRPRVRLEPAGPR